MIRSAVVVRICAVTVLLVAAVGVSVALAEPTLVVKWNDVLLECVRRSKIGPPMVARAVGVTHTCGFDAWAVYDDIAVPTMGEARRPAAERTAANREAAFSYAEYRALLDLFPAQTDYVRSQMRALGYDPDGGADLASPAGTGVACARAVTDFRHGDGSNQLGDQHPGAYSDYTGYVPVNSVDAIVDPNRWQPLAFCDGQGGFVSPPYVAPQWGHVMPFALTRWDQFALAGPKRYPDGRYVAQAEAILRLNAALGDRQKMIAEYWADGPHSELPPGHWTLFAEWVSARDHHTFDDDVKMFFIVGNAEQDAGIAVWGWKRTFDSERPITAIHFLKGGKKVLAYVPFRGPTVIDGRDWMPYQPCSFVTPPFPEYPSGHSAFSAAGAEILKRWSGSDAFGASVHFAAGSGRVEPGFAPAHDVTLAWATFSAAADEAGMSRRYGGIHFEDGDLDSRRLGRLVAGAVWDKAMRYIQGTAGTVPVANAAAAAAAPSAPAVDASVACAIVGAAGSPVGAGCRVSFVLREAGAARITVVDVQGRMVASLVDGSLAAGVHDVVWHGPAAAGVYFVRLESGGRSTARRVLVTG